MSEETTQNIEIPILDVFDRKSLDSLVQHIIDSGALGRSKVYSHLLRYLAERTGDPNPPKEIEVAIHVLGRAPDFDVAKDSVVRVYIHQLRKKLDRYYRDQYPIKFGNDHGFRIVIPKGEYTIAATYFEPTTNSIPLPSGPRDTSPLSYKNLRKNYRPWLIAASVLLAANLLFLLVDFFSIKEQTTPYQAVARHPVWQTIFDDREPLMVVVGDYYIFGELDEAGNVQRMVREFNINSKLDLEDLFMTKPELAWKYYDLDLSYIPEGSAFALNSVSSVLPLGHKRVSVKMMSELTTQDITTHHIIYIGYISGLDRLSDIVFAASGLKVGTNFDELINKESGESYISNAGLPSFHEPFTDFGLLSVIKSAGKNHIMIVAGMRDAGLINTAKILTNETQLDDLLTALHKDKKDVISDSYEALYEVRGLNRQNFGAKLVYSRYLDSNTIWDDARFEASASSVP